MSKKGVAPLRELLYSVQIPVAVRSFLQSPWVLKRFEPRCPSPIWWQIWSWYGSSNVPSLIAKPKCLHFLWLWLAKRLRRCPCFRDFYDQNRNPNDNQQYRDHYMKGFGWTPTTKNYFFKFCSLAICIKGIIWEIYECVSEDLSHLGRMLYQTSPLAWCDKSSEIHSYISQTIPLNVFF